MNGATLLFRQVHPLWIDAGHVSSLAFKPTKKDDGLLSVYNGDLTSAEWSFTHFTLTLGFQSIGVLAVQVAECATEGLSAREDPQPFPEHAVIDFTEMSKSQVATKSKVLRDFAISRGWQHQPGA